MIYFYLSWGYSSSSFKAKKTHKKLLEREKERTFKLTAFQPKAILIGNFYRQQVFGVDCGVGLDALWHYSPLLHGDLLWTEGSKV